MLQLLSIRNIALIESLEMDFSSGFHVLTGETGAGKSIIIDAVNFVLGERASRDLIKSGATKATVEAEIDITGNDAVNKKLDELGVQNDDTLILSRELNISGKGSCRINGTLVNLSTLKSVSDFLVDIHGQHEHQSLLRAEKHINFLDEYDRDSIKPVKQKLAKALSSMQSVKARLLSGFVNEEEKLRRLDILNYQIKEIEAANLLDESEESKLEAKYNVLSNAQHILETLETGYELLSGEDEGSLTNIGEAKRLLESIRDLHEDYEDISARLSEAFYALEDVAHSLRAMASDFDYEPEDLKIIEDRLDLIRNIERKYGSTIPEVLAFYEKSCEEMDALIKSDANKEKLTAEHKKLEEEYLSHAKRLTELRKAAAKRLEKALIEQLKDLGMKSAVFEVSITQTDAYSANGMDSVEFLLSTNAGEPVKPLHKVASGGELSRIMLAFKTIHIGDINTIIFDEIDQGISGHTATIVGQKMRQIAKNHQVICITHLPQIAAMADIHYVVKKTQLQNSTVSTVTRLDEQGRVLELAHIMGAADDNKSAIEHARELLSSSL